MIARFTPGYGFVTFAAMLALLGYFGWHIHGSPSGNIELERLSEKLSRLDQDLTQWRDKTSSFEAQVALLRPESLDPELLDEMARRHLGLTGANEIIVPLK
jgi:cell division protein FtsB